MGSTCRIRMSCLAGISAVLMVSAAWAQRTPPGNANNNAPTKPESRADRSEMAYLGLEAEPLHPALASHLPSTPTHGQGVLVAYVEPDSPADKAGLKEHDVLISYDDQKLFAPEQLAKLVRADKPQREITLGIVRGGKSQQVKLTLGSRPNESEIPQGYFEPRMPGDWNWGFPEQPTLRMQQRRNPDSAWESFDSMTLRKTGDNKFKVEIAYLDKSGKKQQHTFEGTRDEIRHDIEQEKDLPASERSHLLSSLGLPNLGEDRSARFPAWNFGPLGRSY